MARTSDFRLGDRVIYDPKLWAGTHRRDLAGIVVGVPSTGTLDIDFDDGDVDRGAAAESFRLAPLTAMPLQQDQGHGE